MRLRKDAVVLSDSPVQSTPCDSTCSELRLKLDALDMAYAAGALSREMHTKAVEELHLAHTLADGVHLEDNAEVLGRPAASEDSDDEEIDDCRDGWFLVLESNEEGAGLASS